MAGDDALRVLVVCAANQCRSRAAEVLLANALQSSPHIEITSAGVQVEAPIPMCPKAEKYVISQGFAPRDAARPARALTQAMLEQADLVLVADKLVRARVVAMSPTARARTFSLRGAGSAAQYINNHNLVARARQAHEQGQHEATELIDGELTLVCTSLKPGKQDAAHWLRIELEAAQGHAVPSGSHDVDDAHVVLRARHTTALNQIFEACQPLSDVLRALNDGMNNS